MTAPPVLLASVPFGPPGIRRLQRGRSRHQMLQ
jgi:hypothetical protein